MILEELFLELTRNCTIECEHCLRGNREHKNMDFTTLENIFKDVKEINFLLLTGGEPLMNINAIEQISSLIKKYNVEVNRIGIITNGTVLSNRHIIGLKKIKSSCKNFDFVLSNDLFHRLEWSRLKVNSKVEKNFKIYNELFGMRKYPINDTFHNVILSPKGKAKLLTKQRIDEITKNRYIVYKFRDSDEIDNLFFENDYVHGKICVDVNGNLVDYSMSFSEEDNFSNKGFNVNDFSFREAIELYIDDYRKRHYQKRLM